MDEMLPNSIAVPPEIAILNHLRRLREFRMCERRSRRGSRRSLVRSTLGSLFEGAAEQSEAEGVSYVGWYAPWFCIRPP